MVTTDLTIQFIIRLAVAGLLGALIGLDREYRAKEAGTRTHFLVSLGSALIIIVSQWGFGDVVGHPGIGLDPSRVAAQVVSGIGFIGAGTIMMQKQFVRGLTTAAGLWAVSIIGTAIGAGFYTGGTVCYAFILLAMNVLRLVDVRIQSRQKTATVYFELRSKLSIGQLVRLAREKDCTLSELELYADSGYGDNLVCGTFTLWAEGRTSLDDILRELSAVEGVIYLTRI